MKEVTTYLTFDGNTREAMTFYKDCLGAELQMMPFSEGQLPDMPETAKNRIMHARLGKGSSTILMASDTMPGAPYQQGNNFSISLHCESMSEIQGLFNSLGEGGSITMPLQDVFWGAHFGMLKDKFGIHWMFNYEKPKQA